MKLAELAMVVEGLARSLGVGFARGVADGRRQFPVNGSGPSRSDRNQELDDQGKGSQPRAEPPKAAQPLRRSCPQTSSQNLRPSGPIRFF